MTHTAPRETRLGHIGNLIGFADTVNGSVRQKNENFGQINTTAGSNARRAVRAPFLLVKNDTKHALTDSSYRVSGRRVRLQSRTRLSGRIENIGIGDGRIQRGPRIITDTTNRRSGPVRYAAYTASTDKSYENKFV